MKTRNIKRWLAVIAAGLAAVILIAAAGGAFLFRHELKTLYSLKKVDDNVLYTMKYDGDYGFDEFLETGASSDRELVEFVTKRLLKGIPLEFSIPDLGCSTFSAQTEDGDRVFGRNFDLTYSPALFVVTEPENGYRSMSTVNLAFLGFGEDKLPDTLKRKIITLAAPYAPLDGVNEKGLAVAVLRIGDEPTNQDTGRTDITTTTAIRLMLDKAANVDEAPPELITWQHPMPLWTNEKRHVSRELLSPPRPSLCWIRQCGCPGAHGTVRHALVSSCYHFHWQMRCRIH